jgi:putative flippase GtrA
MTHNYYIFSDRPQTAAKSRYALYVAGQVMGALINVGVFMLTIWNWPTLSDKPVIPLMVGSALALVFNYRWANVLVFRIAPLTQAAGGRSGSSTR